MILKLQYRHDKLRHKQMMCLKCEYDNQNSLRLRGFEPPRVSSLDPKSSASANSATAAEFIFTGTTGHDTSGVRQCNVSLRHPLHGQTSLPMPPEPKNHFKSRAASINVLYEDLTSCIVSPPNFSKKHLAISKATTFSATTEAAGTEQTSLRS